jgi:hypothetical protein
MRHCEVTPFSSGIIAYEYIAGMPQTPLRGTALSRRQLELPCVRIPMRAWYRRAGQNDAHPIFTVLHDTFQTDPRGTTLSCHHTTANHYTKFTSPGVP